MSKTISKTWSSAGYDPGQKITLDVTVNWRKKNTVSVSYEFHAYSKGKDYYNYNTRHNKSILEIGSKDITWTYQAKGDKASWKTRDTVLLTSVGNSTTSLKVYFTNKRVWVQHTNKSDPRSTGVISRTYLGEITFSANSKHTITFKAGNSDPDSTILGLPKSVTSYYGSSVKLPAITTIKDQNNHYYVSSFYSKKNIDTVNLYSSSRDDCRRQRTNYTIPNSNVSLYATWIRQAFNYVFYADSTLIKEDTYTYGEEEAPQAPLLEFEYKRGYELNNWKSVSTAKEYDPGAEIRETCQIVKEYSSATESVDVTPVSRFDAQWKPITGKVVFHFKADGVNDITADYTYATSTAINGLGQYIDTTNIRPGYKLIGWAYSPPSTIYLPGEASGYIYPADYIGEIEYPNSNFSNTAFINGGIQLYAVWEYYTTTYVYTNKGSDSTLKYKLAMPYVYSATDKKWKICLAYVYTNKGLTTTQKWKL